MQPKRSILSHISTNRFHHNTGDTHVGLSQTHAQEMAEDVLKKQEMYTERMEKLMQKANAMMLLSKSEERREGLSILRQEIDGLIDDLEYFRTIFDQQKWRDDESYRKFTSAALNMARSLSSDLHRKARTLKKDRPRHYQHSITSSRMSRDMPAKFYS